MNSSSRDSDRGGTLKMDDSLEALLGRLSAED